MDQPTFADLEYASKKRKTRREIFLERIDSLVPWDRLEGRIRTFYPKAGRGRRPYELSAMLRIHCVRLFYNLSDPGMEDMLYEVESVRRFVGLRLSGPLPDETTILNFRHLLEEHELGRSLFEEVNRHLESQGLRLREGTTVDASLIEAPSTTKNRTGGRDPEMRQTKKGNEWHFGYAKVRYRGLAKNTQRLVLLLGLTNLMTAERLAARRGQSAPKQRCERRHAPAEPL